MSHQLTNIVSPGHHDVLFGRGNNINSHPGNCYFRTLVKNLRFEYIATPKAEKSFFAKLIVQQIRSLNPPGRFLREDKNSKMWYDVEDSKAIDKTRQALREGAPEIGLQIEKGEIKVQTRVKEAAIANEVFQVYEQLNYGSRTEHYGQPPLQTIPAVVQQSAGVPVPQVPVLPAVVQQSAGVPVPQAPVLQTMVQPGTSIDEGFPNGCHLTAEYFRNQQPGFGAPQASQQDIHNQMIATQAQRSSILVPGIAHDINTNNQMNLRESILRSSFASTGGAHNNNWVSRNSLHLANLDERRMSSTAQEYRRIFQSLAEMDSDDEEQDEPFEPFEPSVSANAHSNYYNYAQQEPEGSTNHMPRSVNAPSMRQSRRLSDMEMDDLSTSLRTSLTLNQVFDPTASLRQSNTGKGMGMGTSSRKSFSISRRSSCSKMNVMSMVLRQSLFETSSMDFDFDESRQNFYDSQRSIYVPDVFESNNERRRSVLATSAAQLLNIVYGDEETNMIRISKANEEAKLKEALSKYPLEGVMTELNEVGNDFNESFSEEMNSSQVEITRGSEQTMRQLTQEAQRAVGCESIANNWERTIRQDQSLDWESEEGKIQQV